MGGGGHSTSNTVAEPWEEQQGYLKDVFSQAQNLYNNGGLAPAYFSGSTVAGQSPYTRQAYNAISGQAVGGDNAYGTMGTAFNTANDIMRNAVSGNTGLARLNAFTNINVGNKAIDNLNGVTAEGVNSGNYGAGMLETLARQRAGAGNAGLDQLNTYSARNFNRANSGLNVLNDLSASDNPYVDELYRRANGQAQASLDSNFNRAGRYGSGAHEAAAADAANNLANQMYSDLYDKRASAAAQAGGLYNQGVQMNVNAANAAADAYNTALGQKINAANQAGSQYLQGYDTATNAQQAAGSLYNTGWGNNIAARNDAATAYNNALQTALTGAATGRDLYGQRYEDAQWLSEAGANQENYNQALIDAAIDRYNYDQQRALTALSNYNQLIQGTYGGTTTATGKSGYTGSALGSALGGAALGASLLGGANSLLDYFQ